MKDLLGKNSSGEKISKISNKKSFINRLFRLILGLFLFSLGTYFTIQANIGYSAWDVLNSGIINIVDLRMGQSTILVGAIIMIYVVLQNGTFGVGTLFNVILIGYFLDILMIKEILPLSQNWILGFFMLITGLFIIALGSYFYIGAGMGTGPRDALMILFARKTGWTAGRTRIVIEFTVAFIGFLLGGNLGIGTLIASQCMGMILDFVFKILSFDVKGVVHQNIPEFIGEIKKEML